MKCSLGNRKSGLLVIIFILLQGNELFKNGNYTLAIEAYTKGIDLDPCNPLLPANRAMGLLKQQK